MWNSCGQITYVQQSCGQGHTVVHSSPRPWPAVPAAVSFGATCSLYPAPVNIQHILYAQLLSTDSMFFMPSSCQQTCSLCPAPVNRQHVLYSQLLSTDIFFTPCSCQQLCSLCPASVNRQHILYASYCQQTHSLCPAPVNRHVLCVRPMSTHNTFSMYSPYQQPIA